MTGLSCNEGFFCAPGIKEGKHVVLCLSPGAYRTPVSDTRFIGCLAHEISHHIIHARAHTTLMTMTRKMTHDLPMWFEEGLCQVIQCELDTQFHENLLQCFQETSTWYSLEQLWNDLSAAPDVKTAYRQAYIAVLYILNRYGKSHIMELLSLNATKAVDWATVMAELSVLFE